MPTTVSKSTRFELSQRVRTDQKAPNALKVKLALIDRIAELPGIKKVDCEDDASRCQINIYLKCDPAKSQREGRAGPMLCSITRDGIAIRGLDQWARHQVISRGWGKLELDGVLVFLPRNDRELDTVWTVIRRAYDNLFNPSANIPGVQIVSTWDWPKFSRTSLQ